MYLCVEPLDWHIGFHPWFAGKEEGDPKPLSFLSKRILTSAAGLKKIYTHLSDQAEQHKETK